MATFKELSENIGKVANAVIPIDGKGSSLSLDCEITDCRIIYGRMDFQLKYNEQVFWLSSDRITIKE